MIYCLSLKTGRLSEEVEEILFWLAHKMLGKEQKYLIEKNDLFRAEIMTDFKQTGIGTIFGTVFRGDVEFRGKEISIVYIVNPEKPPKHQKLQFFTQEFSDAQIKAHLN